MTNRWIFFPMLALCVVSASSVLAQDRASGKASTIYVDGTPIQKFLQEYSELSTEGVVSALREAAGQEPDKPLTGFASLVEQSVQDFGKSSDEKLTGYEKCDDARKDKEKWHLDHGGKIPDGFGKIVSELTISPDNKGVWTGQIELCTWIHNVEYYFVMDFHTGGPKPMKLYEKQTNNPNDPFPGTLDFSALSDPGSVINMINNSGFNWKLHAGGNSITFVTAKKQGQDLPANHELFSDPASNCFDMFFKDEPMPGQLPPQPEYCMGRCNALILNTP